MRSQPVGIDCGSTCSAPFGDGTSVILTATASAGQQFASWSGACSGSTATCTLAMSADRSVVATFSAAPAAPAWQTAQLLESNNDFNVGSAVLTAISPKGDAMVMWGAVGRHARRQHAQIYCAAMPPARAGTRRWWCPA